MRTLSTVFSILGAVFFLVGAVMLHRAIVLKIQIDDIHEKVEKMLVSCEEINVENIETLQAIQMRYE